MITKFILTENLNFSFGGFFLCLARIPLPPILFVRFANLLTLSIIYQMIYNVKRFDNFFDFSQKISSQLIQDKIAHHLPTYFTMFC